MIGIRSTLTASEVLALTDSGAASELPSLESDAVACRGRSRGLVPWEASAVFQEIGMKKVVRSAAIGSMLATLFATVAAAQTTSRPIGKNGDVEFTEAVTVGATVLPPGHYRFKHSFQNGQHYLLINRQRMTIPGPAGAGTNRHYGGGKGTEVARVPCDVVLLDAAVKQTEVHTVRQADGSQIVTQIRIAGEGASHLLVLEPQR